MWKKHNKYGVCRDFVQDFGLGGREGEGNIFQSNVNCDPI